MARVQAEVPTVTTIDLDDIDREASAALQLHPNWKQMPVCSEELGVVHSERQRLLDGLLLEAMNQRRKAIVFGIHVEGETVYEMSIRVKLLLARPMAVVVNDRLARDKPALYAQWRSHENARATWAPSIFSVVTDYAETLREKFEREASDHIRYLTSRGYREISPEEAFEVLCRLCSR
jgi:hypothetical protein